MAEGAGACDADPQSKKEVSALTLSSRPQSPSVEADTPVPDTATLAAIRAWTHSARGWWQFELRPWHYWTALTSAAVITAAFVALLATLGHLR